DVLTGGASRNTIDGGSGNDRITGGAGNDTLIGGEGNDLLYSMGGDDWLLGGAGNDTYYLNQATGVILQENFNEGIDTVITSADGFLNDNFERLILTGTAVHGTGNDLANTITGNAGFNVLRGYGGNDTISGGEGQDIIWGGTGADVLTGGAGADTFGFDSLETAKERDVIRDFTAGSDSLVFDRRVFTALGGSASNGALDPNSFVLGKKAMTAEHRLIYDPASGALFYDADGVGGMAQVQVATLSTKPVLGPGDIFLL
uniref:calcium-binding protein n=1 Tax=Novosphingobium sp. TaxID=1874826 RepID=UPI002638B6EA